MKKLVLLQGLPASWKSTWAMWEINGFIISKDRIRKEEGHFPAGYFYSKENEKTVMEIERQRVEIAMHVAEFPYIIIDNTHLNRKDGQENKHIQFYRKLAEKYGYEVEIKSFPITVEEAIIRNYNRPEEDRVPEKAIRQMAKSSKIPLPYPENPVFKEWTIGLPTCVICDIDWTLAFMDGKRSPYDYSKVGGDRRNEMLIKLFANLEDDIHYLIVSWRKSECRDVTKKWLKDSWISIRWFAKLYMRADWDDRCDSIVKEEIYREHIEGKYNVLAVFDDRDRVCEMWRLKLNLPCYQVWWGNF